MIVLSREEVRQGAQAYRQQKIADQIVARRIAAVTTAPSSARPAARAPAPPPAPSAAQLRAAEVCRMCIAAGRDDLMVDFLERRLTVEQAKQELAVALWEPHLRAAQSAW